MKNYLETWLIDSKFGRAACVPVSSVDLDIAEPSRESK
jgi:hypothetical protein